MKNELVKLLVEAGLDKKAATAKVQNMFETVKKLRPEDSEEKIWAIVRLKVLEFATAVKRSGAKAFEGIVIGFTEYRDVLEGIKRSILAEYESDPERAIAEGLVRVEEDGTIVPLDNRPTLPSGDPNPNFGKPIPTLTRRTIYMVIDGELKRCTGDVADEPEIGSVYKFAGTDRGDYITISRFRPFKKDRKVDATELWEVALGALEKYAVDLGELTGNEDGIVAVKGMVTFTTDTSTGNQLIVVDDADEPLGDGVPIFVLPSAISDAIVTGSEVVAFGTTYPTTDEEGNTRVVINGFGVIVNPETKVYGDILQELDEIVWEE